jgi:hypothetical protein
MDNMRAPMAIAALASMILAANPVSGAPSKPAVQGLILEYASSALVTVKPQKGKTLSLGKGLEIGDAIAPGSTIITGKGNSVELKLVPNGSIFKLTPETTFKFEAIASTPKSDNVFSLAAGKIRAVAATNTKEGYVFKTPNTMLGVRGTDFVLAFLPGKTAKVLVKKGAIEFAKLDARGKELEAIMVSEGEEADAYDEEFEAEEYDEEEFEEFYEDADFEELDEDEVSDDEEYEYEAEDEDEESEEEDDSSESDEAEEAGADEGGDTD